MIYIRTLLFAGVMMTLTGVSLSQDRPAHSFTDQELKRAGWSEQQIAELRATSPQTRAPQTRAPQESSSESTPANPAQIDYSSIFDSYIPFDYVPDIDWREANDNVGRIGGWRAYLELVQDAVKPEAETTEKESE